jgi:hypothetical protein
MEFGSLACGLDDAPVGWLVSVCWVAIHAVVVLSDFFFSRTYGALVKFVSTHARNLLLHHTNSH